MRRFLTGSVTTLALCALSFPALAAPPAEDEPVVEDDEDDLVIDEDAEEMNQGAPDPAGDPAGGGGDPDFLQEEGEGKAEVGIGGDTPAGAEAAGPALSDEDKRKLEEKDITVVQQQAFLNVYKKDGDPAGKTVRRVELQPQIGLSVNDAFVRHYSVGLEIDYWLTNRMAIGITGTGFFGAKTPNYERIRFQEGLLLTANRYLWEASVVYQYEPFYGKIALFNRLLLHWEAYVQIGGGILQSQVIPRFESIHDPFNNFNGQINFAIGSRYYIQNLDWLSINLGVRTWGFFDLYEPQNRGVDVDPSGNNESSDFDNPALDDPAEAKAAAKAQQSLGDRLAFNTVFFIGVSFHLPPTFEYSTRR